MTGAGEPALDREAMLAFLAREFPGAGFGDGRLVLADYARGRCRVVMPFDPATVRPGPSVSGPAIMALGDVSAWVALLSVIGSVPLAVTANLNVSFLRPAGLSDLACDCRVLRAGRRLATMLADVLRLPEEVQVAHLTITYAIPEEARP
ncbi:PaaI family thioesterase [Elioraea thermophila]|uniref:PaaI family thioesterase n=1 Tax=Elioraea thermophila TaxID=2185104 RepID=UPI000DF21C90|nr:PaaI family thioesterase [Elioraea thermophila]